MASDSVASGCDQTPEKHEFLQRQAKFFEEFNKAFTEAYLSVNAVMDRHPGARDLLADKPYALTRHVTLSMAVLGNADLLKEPEKLAECWRELVNDGVAGIRLEELQEH